MCATETRKRDIPPLAGNESARDDTDGAGEAKGDGDAVQRSEDNKLDSGFGKAAGENEASGQGAASQVDRPASDYVGDAAGEKERAATSKGVNGRWPVKLVNNCKR